MRDWRPVEGRAFFREWVWAALMVHLQLALLVDCDVVLKWKVHRLSALVNPSRNVLGKSSKKSGSRPPKTSGFFGIFFTNVVLVFFYLFLYPSGLWKNSSIFVWFTVLGILDLDRILVSWKSIKHGTVAPACFTMSFTSFDWQIQNHR